MDLEQGQISVAGSPRRSSGSGLVIRIRGLLASLSRAERRIADVVLEDPLRVSGLSISALAAEARVSDTSVTRFCRQLGLGGYTDLRLALYAAADQSHLERKLTVGATGLITSGDTAVTVATTIAEQEIRALRDTLEQLDDAAVDAVAAALASARRVHIYAVGSSALVAADLEFKLQHLGLGCSAWSDVHRALMSASHVGDRDVAVGISYSGRTPETLQPLGEAKNRSAVTVGLTNDPGSPLSALTDLTVTSAGLESQYRTGATVSRIAQLFVVDCIYVRTAQRLGHTSGAALIRAHEAVQLRTR